ncbi:winged helix-turn-helix domain-containing protein [Marinicella meishanensis]|uniref:winged helix-turn-helix domain-containing protein n=1 Tax=Marinicella meishanensis TaxID=2873263 RepID=UPI001CBDCB3C|nr:hypothetical protein [Marinicella sp. NBU2979]
MKYNIKDIEIDTTLKVVKHKHLDTELKGLNLKFFLTLVKHYPKAVRADTLENEVWKGKVVSSETINKRYSLLSKALIEEMGQAELIKSLGDREYQLLAQPIEIKAVNEFPPLSIFKNRKILLFTLVLTALLIGAYLMFQQKDERPVLIDPISGKKLIAPED